MLKLVTYNKSSNFCSLADEFDYVVEQEGKIKHISLYHQRRFAKLRYSATSIIAAFDLMQMLFHETEKDNLLLQSYKLYMECQFFFTKLEALSCFTHKLTLPLLNCVAASSQKDLLQVLAAFHCFLADGKMHTLDKYRVSYKHLPVAERDSELVKEILYLTCVDAAYVVKLQCGREYGFADDSQLLRAKQLDKLTEDELFRLPTNNLNTESDFSKFSRLSEVAKFRNYSF